MSSDSAAKPVGRAVSVQELAADLKAVLTGIVDDRSPVTVTLDGRPILVITPVDTVQDVAENIDTITAEHGKAPLDRRPSPRRVAEVLDARPASDA